MLLPKPSGYLWCVVSTSLIALLPPISLPLARRLSHATRLSPARCERSSHAVTADGATSDLLRLSGGRLIGPHHEAVEDAESWTPEGQLRQSRCGGARGLRSLSDMWRMPVCGCAERLVKTRRLSIHVAIELYTRVKSDLKKIFLYRSSHRYFYTVLRNRPPTLSHHLNYAPAAVTLYVTDLCW